MKHQRCCAILSAGPSLRTSWELSKYGTRLEYRQVMAVNRAPNLSVVRRFGYDWWCAGDDVLLVRQDIVPSVDPRVGVLTMQPGIRRIRSGQTVQRLPADIACVDWDIPARLIPDTLPLGWTFACSLALCAMLGFQTIDCYGVDWHGTTGCDGSLSAQGSTEDETRWQREQRETVAIIDYLTTHRGMDIRRIGPHLEEIPWSRTSETA